MDGLTGTILTAAVVAAVWFDVRERRIPNALTVSTLGLALLLRSLDGPAEVGSGLMAAGICLLLALPFFLAGGLGGGDVKLLTAVGAFLGPERLASALLVTAFVGGGLALVAMVRKRAVGRTFWNLYILYRTLGRRTFTGWRKDGREAVLTLESPGAVTIPYGVAISAGALWGWFL